MNHRAGRVTQDDHTPRDTYAEVTNQVIAALEAGTPPWRMPWDPDKAGGPAMPCNAITGARYRGINVLALGMSTRAFISGDPRWATYKQAADRGWQVRKGERGTAACLFKRIELRDNDTDGAEPTKRIPLLRNFTLFHASQIDGIPAYAAPTMEEAPWRAPEATEIIVANSKAVIRTGGDRAFYSPSTDHIQMPPRQSFRSAAGWSGTIVHELAHWTGSPSRLDRNMRGEASVDAYAREELRAEIAMCMVCAEANIDDRDFESSAAYIDDWLKALRSDRKEVFRAAADAQRIADYLLAFHPDFAASSERSPRDGAADTEPANPAAAFERAA